MRQVIGFLFSCLVLGIILHWLGATPSTLGVWLADMGHAGADKVKGLLSWGGGYVIMGAMILVPIAIIRWALKKRR